MRHPSPRRGSADDAARLTQQLSRLARWRAVTHLAVALVEDGGRKVTWAARGADDRSDFEIGSVTKGLTGLLLADAVDRGEVTLGTTLGEVLELGDAPAGQVTLEALATHSSGLPSLGPGMAWRGWWTHARGGDPYRGTSPDDVVDQLRATRVGRPRARYSNFGFAALGLALAAASDRTFPQLVRERIFEPLRMTDSYVPTSPAELRPAALPGHSARGADREPWILDGYAAAGGVRSSARDMSRLVAALLAGTAPGIGALEPRAEFSHRTQIGLAWITSADAAGQELTWHNGMTGGFSAMLALHRESGRGTVVLNASGRIVDDIGRGILTPTDA